MYLCYIDESGTAEIPGTTSHFILAGFSVHVCNWKQHEQEITEIKNRFGLAESEIHTAWMLRKYPEQTKVPSFDGLSYVDRLQEIEKHRRAELFSLQKRSIKGLVAKTNKYYRSTAAYIHLSHQQRRDCIFQIASLVGQWADARLFAECIDKTHFDLKKATHSLDEQAFEQLVSRFEQYLEKTKKSGQNQNYGLLIHDNNETIAKKHTSLMRSFHEKGTLWTQVKNIIETPLFVSSELTSMVQIADLCAYALRRYLENNEDELFNLIFQKADRNPRGVVVGVRHFSRSGCTCQICASHRQ